MMKMKKRGLILSMTKISILDLLNLMIHSNPTINHHTLPTHLELIKTQQEVIVIQEEEMKS